jgi:hypothetical protein
MQTDFKKHTLNQFFSINVLIFTDNGCFLWLTCYFEIANTSEKTQVIQLINEGHSMGKAAFLADIGKAQASHGLHELGTDVYNRVWVKQSEST